jgi:phosphoglycolate phosphatase
MTPVTSSIPSRIDLIVYDLDGTLLDAFEDIMIALNHALDHFGLEPHPLESVKSFVGDGIEVFINRALSGVPRDRMREVRNLFIEGYRSPQHSTARVYPGTLEFLRSVRVSGRRQAVLTNKPHPIALTSCDGVGIGPLVDHVQGTDREHPLKPNPKGLRAMLSDLGVESGTTLFVGDGRPDMEVSAAAGIAAIGCSWGTQSAAQLLEQGAVRVIDSITELKGILDAAG